jgi:hypothetical protein
MHGGLTEPVVQDVENLYRCGGKEITDVINIHTFVDPASPMAYQRFDEIITGTHDVMKKYGDENKKIWITEMGCPGVPANKGPLTWFGGGNVTEEQQAVWLDKQFDLRKRHPSIEKMFWAFYRDTKNEFNDATDYFGLVRLDQSPKPSYHRFKKLISEWKETAKN